MRSTVVSASAAKYYRDKPYKDVFIGELQKVFPTHDSRYGFLAAFEIGEESSLTPIINAGIDKMTVESLEEGKERVSLRVRFEARWLLPDENWYETKGWIEYGKPVSHDLLEKQDRFYQIIDQHEHLYCFEPGEGHISETQFITYDEAEDHGDKTRAQWVFDEFEKLRHVWLKVFREANTTVIRAYRDVFDEYGVDWE